MSSMWRRVAGPSTASSAAAADRACSPSRTRAAASAEPHAAAGCSQRAGGGRHERRVEKRRRIRRASADALRRHHEAWGSKSWRLARGAVPLGRVDGRCRRPACSRRRTPWGGRRRAAAEAAARAGAERRDRRLPCFTRGVGQCGAELGPDELSAALPGVRLYGMFAHGELGPSAFAGFAGADTPAQPCTSLDAHHPRGAHHRVREGGTLERREWRKMVGSHR